MTYSLNLEYGTSEIISFAQAVSFAILEQDIARAVREVELDALQYRINAYISARDRGDAPCDSPWPGDAA